MGYRHSKEQILEGALAAAFDEGLSQLTFGRLAKRLGINDRVIVYYFPTKEDLIGEVLVSLGAELQAALAPAFVDSVANHVELLEAIWPLVARDEFDPVFAVFFEASGQAASGCEPYRTLVPRLVESWVDWAGEFIRGTPAQRRSESAAAIAVIDGLLLLRQLAGPEAADRAAIGLGITKQPSRSGARRRRANPDRGPGR